MSSALPNPWSELDELARAWERKVARVRSDLFDLGAELVDVVSDGAITTWRAKWRPHMRAAYAMITGRTGDELLAHVAEHIDQVRGKRVVA